MNTFSRRRANPYVTDASAPSHSRHWSVAYDGKEDCEMMILVTVKRRNDPCGSIDILFWRRSAERQDESDGSGIS